MMGFILVKQQAYSVRIAIVLLAGFTADSFWNMLLELAGIIWKKGLRFTSVLVNLHSTQFYKKRSSWGHFIKKSNVVMGKTFFSKVAVLESIPAILIKTDSTGEVFRYRFFKIALIKISEIFLRDNFAIPFLAGL